jgi:hypothetical protein
MRQKGSAITKINFFIAACLVLAAAGWFLIQKGCHTYYRREADIFFEKIEKKEISYKNINNRYLPFNIEKSAEALEALKLDPKGAKYYNFSVEEIDNKTFRIIAYLKPEIIKKWYLHTPNAKFRLIYEKREGEKGRLVD